jgi:tRNA-dependent cyclodipeptide synthase
MYGIKPVFKVQNNIDQTIFQKSRCLLTISVGQEAHEGDKFGATIDLVNAAFESIILLIDDSLQRHSMALNKTQDADFFYNASMAAGDAWLARNRQYYQKLDNLEQIIRWDKWLKHPHYLEKYRQIKTLLSNDNDYQHSFDETITAFLKRNPQNRYVEDKNARKLCLDYLIEECAALCLWPEINANFEVYPSKRNSAMSQTHQRFVLAQYPELLHPVAIKFKNRKQFKPQNFELKESSYASIEKN